MKSQLDAQIKKVDAEKIRPLRHSELRQGKPFSSTSYLRDHENDTFHMACFVGEKIVTCATFYPESTDKIKSEKAYRLRGMATDSEFQRKGYAKKLMIESFRELKGKGCDLLWCNARLVAIEFYQSLGFKTLGNIFDVEDIGPHYYMHKEIAK